MAEKYVKLDDVIKAIGGVPKRKESPYPTPIHLAAERVITKLKERIEKIPTADVKKVVKCEECAYRKECNKEIYVEGSYSSVNSCSYGERRTDDDV